MTVSSAGFAKPAVEITLPWKYVCCTPSGVISGLPSLSRGSQRLGFTADTNVSHSYPPQKHCNLPFQWYAACSRTMCSQAKTAISKRMAGLLMGNDIIQFGNYLQAEQCTRGGFLPIFWDAPYSYINASIDIGEVVDWITDKFVVANKGDLAVLQTRNGFQALVEQSYLVVSRPVQE